MFTKLPKTIIISSFLALGGCSGIYDLFPDDLFSSDLLSLDTKSEPVDVNAKNAEKLPSFKVGDSFSFNSPDMTWRVTAIDGDKINWQNNGGDIQITAQNPLLPALEWKSEKRGEGRRIISEMNGNFFPLEVGKQVSFKTTVNTNKPPYACEFDWTCDFVSQEVIAVPAGSFDTYRIDCYRQKPERWSFFYAPSVGYYVKMESNNAANPNDVKVRELVKFFHGDMTENPMMISNSVSEEAMPSIQTAPVVEMVVEQPVAVVPKAEEINTVPVSQIKQIPTVVSGYGAHIESYKKTTNIEPAWQQLIKKHPNQLAGFQKIVKRVDLGTKGVFDRLIIGPFNNEKSAISFCKTLKLEGQKYCQAVKL